MSEVLLDIKDLEVVYTHNRKTVHAVNGVTLKLEKGRTLGLVGETGAGKTTIAKSVMRLLPDKGAKIAKGKIDLDGIDILHISEEEMCRMRGKKAAMVFQDPMTALNPLLTVGDQILEVIMLHNDFDKKKGMEKACEMLEMVGISRKRYLEYPHQFSGGMRQRVVIAMALACDPQLLLADEPTTALDVTIQAQVLDLIKDLAKKNNTSMIMITHDLGVVAETCDDVAVIYAGQIVEQGPKNEIFHHPIHPYTVGLFNALPSMAVGQKRLHSIAGLPPDPTDLPEGCSFWPRCPYAAEGCKKPVDMRQAADGHYYRCVRGPGSGEGRKEESNG